MVFPVVMYGCEIWTIKKAEHRRIDAFELWCWRRFLRVPWTARRSNQSILKEISPECSLEGLMLKLKLQYFGHLTWRTDSSEETLMLGKIEGGRRRGHRQFAYAGCETMPSQKVFANAYPRNDHKPGFSSNILNPYSMLWDGKLYFLADGTCSDQRYNLKVF